MHLVLIKTSIDFVRVNPQDGVYKRNFDSDVIRISRDDVKRRNRKDHVVQMFITELFRGRDSEMKVHLRDGHKPDEYTLELKNIAKVDVLEKLRLRFEDKVRISVRIKLSSSRVGTAKEMAIKECNSCSGLIKLFLDVDGCEEFNCDCNRGDEKCVYEIIPYFTARIHIIASMGFHKENLQSAPKDPPGKTILEQGLCSDLTIIAKDNVQVAAHKIFFSAASPVFRVQFGSKWDKGVSSTKLDMSDTSVKGLNAFLRYVYYQDRLKDVEQEPELAFELLTLAHKYNISSLEASTILLLIDLDDKHFSTELAYIIYTFVRCIEAFAELKWKVARVLMSNVENFDKLEDYQKLLAENPDLAEKLREEIAGTAEKDYLNK